MSLYNLQQRFQTAGQIRRLAQSGDEAQAQELLQTVRDAIHAETARHYAFTAAGGRGSPDGVAWESTLKAALEDRLGLTPQHLCLGTEGWYWG